MLRNIDSWILDRVYQPIADRIWDWWEVTCFDVALLVAGANFIVGSILYILVEGNPFSIRILFDALIILWMQANIRFASSLVKEGFDNPYRYQMVWMRIIILGLCLATVPSEIIGVIWSGAWKDACDISVLYFIACRLRPKKPKPVTLPVGVAGTHA